MIWTAALTLSLITALSAPLALAETSGQGAQLATPSVEDYTREEQSLLQRHHPFYFAYGNLSKLQLSFKTPIIKNWPVYFGYTQFMFWAIKEKSAPFKDLTYKPEVFYRLDNHENSILRSVDFGVWEHNSNGKAGQDSRSYNSNYLRLNFERSGHRWLTRFSTQVSVMHGFDDTNRDIQNYVGPLSINFSFIQLFDAWIDSSEVSLLASPGGKFAHKWDRGGYQLSWSFRISGVPLYPAIYLQYYRGYAETLINYNESVNAFRAGVIF